MSNKIAIKADDLGKQYHIGVRQTPYKTIRETLVETARAPFRRMSSLLRGHAYGAADMEEAIWALKDVTFEVEPGEVVGIIGRNGAGKSTLLKILSRITEPTAGSAEIRGRVGSLLEVGTGFHPELTGRENILLNGAILGMRKSEITRKFDEIVAFAEVEKFIDTPVKFYSSGMYVRLAFAVAAHLEPEILLVDEVLAVGDIGFQKKCLGKMEDVAKGGRTVLFVSHNMGAIANLCKRTLLIESGAIAAYDETPKVITAYLRNISKTVNSVPLLEREDRSGSGVVKFKNFRIEDDKGTPLQAVHSGQDVVFIFDYISDGQKPYGNVDFGFGAYSSSGEPLFVLYSSYTGKEFNGISRSGSICCKVPRLPLAAGRYRIGARITVAGEEADWPYDGIGYLDVETGDFFGTGNAGFDKCPILVDGAWFAR